MKNRKSYQISLLILVILLIFKNPFTACTHDNLSFYKKILHDFDTSSYFVALNIKSPDYKGRAIIENNNLYQYLNKAKGLDKKEYIQFMIKTLSHHRALKLSGDDIIAWKFIKVQEVQSVMLVASRGLDNFIEYYFNGSVLNIVVTEIEQNAIISQLFYWKIPAKIGKMTGNLIIG